MTAFARPSLIHDRYAEIAETSAYTYDDDNLVNYGEFLQNHGRYMTKGGYVDSSRRIRSLLRQQDDLQYSKHDEPALGCVLLPSLGKSAPPSITTSRKTKTSDSREFSTSASVSGSHDNRTKEFDRQMRFIKSEMIKAKQKEREVKRLEGDIKKEQRHLRQSFRKLDVDATAKRYHAEKNLSKNLGEKDKIEREFIKNREKQTRERTDRMIDTLQTNKDKDRRNLLLCNDLARQYRTKTNQLDIKHHQLGRINTEFEEKVHQKELEENRLKKELAEIALALNLEAQKAKTEMNDFLNMVDRDRTQTIKQDLTQEQKLERKLNQTNAHIKNHEFERRRHSADMTTRRSMLDLKQREALRRIGDTKNRLETISNKQRQLNASASFIEQDRRAIQSTTKNVDHRRSHSMNRYIRDKTEKSTKYDTDKAKTYHTELETKHHEDRVRHLEKVLNKNKELEFELRKSVKEAEFQRRKKEQEIQRLRDDLVHKKQEDARKIRAAIAQVQYEERELERHLTKENGKLDKLQTRQGNKFTRIARQQEYLRESKSLLKNHEREHKRLLRAETHSQSTQSLDNI